MKKLKIYDFDGVLFKHPWICLSEMSFTGEIPEALYFRLSMEGGTFTEEMIAEPTIKPYYELFLSKYFSQKMSVRNIQRLEKASREAKLVIASLNYRSPIERLLSGSNILHLFDSIFSLEDTRDKGEMLRRACVGFDPSKNVSFVTDTVYDIETAIKYNPNMEIEVVLSGADSKRSILGYVSEDKIVEPYY